MAGVPNSDPRQHILSLSLSFSIIDTVILMMLREKGTQSFCKCWGKWVTVCITEWDQAKMGSREMKVT